MKKFIAIVLLVLLAASSLSACSQNPGPLNPAEPVDIMIWNYYNGEQRKAFEDMVQEFNQTEGLTYGVLVETISKTDLRTLGRQVLISSERDPAVRSLPALLFCPADIAYTLQQRGLLAAFDAYYSPEELAAFEPRFLQEGMVAGDNQHYILPVAKSTEMLTVNKTYFDAFLQEIDGDPAYGAVSYSDFATWEGIVHAAEVYRQWITDRYGPLDERALFGVDSVLNLIYTSQFGLDTSPFAINGGHGSVNLHPDHFAPLWDIYVTPTMEGFFASFGRYRSDDFRTGDIIAFLGSNASASYLTNGVADDQGNRIPVELLVLPMPVFQEGSPAAMLRGAGVAMTKSTVEQEAASALFVKWLTEPQRNLRFAKRAGYLPVTTEALQKLSAELSQSDPGDIRHAMLLRSLEQIQGEYALLTPPLFADAYEVGLILENTLQSLTLEIRAQIIEEESAGSHRDYILSKYPPASLWEQYLDDCARQLEGLDVTVLR